MSDLKSTEITIVLSRAVQLVIIPVKASLGIMSIISTRKEFFRFRINRKCMPGRKQQVCFFKKSGHETVQRNFA